MANLCFNLKQDEKQEANIRRIMAECQTQWDAARRTFKAELERQNARTEPPAR